MINKINEVCRIQCSTGPEQKLPLNRKRKKKSAMPKFRL